MEKSRSRVTKLFDQFNQINKIKYIFANLTQ